MNEQTIERQIRQLCLDGLMTDGAHHKQWYLEQILETLGFNLEAMNPDECRWESGIPN